MRPDCSGLGRVVRNTDTGLTKIAILPDFVNSTISSPMSPVLEIIIIIIIIIIWFGDTVTVSHPTKCNTNSKVRALS